MCGDFDQVRYLLVRLHSTVAYLHNSMLCSLTGASTILLAQPCHPPSRCDTHTAKARQHPDRIPRELPCCIPSAVSGNVPA